MGNDCHGGLGASAVPLVDDATGNRLPLRMRRPEAACSLWELLVRFDSLVLAIGVSIS